MQHTKHPMRYALSAAIALALSPALAIAQEAAPAAPADQEAKTLDAVVVSGTAKFKGLRKRDASFSISTATPEQIQETAPTSTARRKFRIFPSPSVRSARRGSRPA